VTPSRRTQSSETRALTLKALRTELQALGSPKRAEGSLRFFKTGPGDYGEGDKFLGLTVPEMRALARKYRSLSDKEALELLQSPWHEERLVALILLVGSYERGDEARRNSIHRSYLAMARHINNWDLVDASAAQIVGRHLRATDIALLEKLARSTNLWERRIAIVSTLAFIRQDEFRPTLKISGMLLRDEHDLIQKAVGWMLREVGKRDIKTLDAFLKKHYQEMPRTMLRYAIERHPDAIRKKYLAGTV
jgi:3-methyladenine DNA glycosylase AlkD